MDATHLQLGARWTEGKGTEFLVWAPHADRVRVRLVSPVDRFFRLRACGAGYFAGCEPDVEPGARYFYQLSGGTERADPASRCQPDGVHGASQVVDSRFTWRNAAWRGLELADYVIYELHVGTFTEAGTLDAIISELASLRELGITAVELMPLAQFPGTRNWGYDGVYPFAVQNSYGGPQALKRLVDGCHAHGLSVVLDVVYNHLGPEGNYLANFGPYFTERHRTNWGAALNFDGPDSDAVRRYFIENALMWIDEFRIDALRLDAVHAIFDGSARPFLRELASAVHKRATDLNRKVYLIAESNLNDPRLLEAPDRGGMGLDAQWLDDFQRAAFAMLTGEQQGYYCDFGCLQALQKSLAEGYVLDGQYSQYRRRHYGASSKHLPPTMFVGFLQNHDQVGNRGGGERLAHLVDFERQKLAAALVTLGPYIPLLFMGEEYGETNPFHYFISHLDPTLVDAVRKGRARDLANFQQQFGSPDPQAEETFIRSRLNRAARSAGQHAVLFAFYNELLTLRKRLRPLRHAERNATHVEQSADVLLILRQAAQEQSCLILNFGSESALQLPQLDGCNTPWHLELDSADRRWGGPGSKILSERNNLDRVQMQPNTTILLHRCIPND